MQPGDVLGGKYRIDRLIGDGGMGSVFEAEHLLLGSRVAVKVLHPDLARRPGIGDRFLQEARVAAQIRSPFVVHVTDVDRTPDGVAYLVMELLDGEPLSAVLNRDNHLPISTACDYTLQILRALEAAHALGVIHRDLKPENVFVTSTAHSGGSPIVKLIDFGIAKLKTPQTKNMTAAGVMLGTAEYMSPEQVHAASEVDGRADLYAVGVMLYEMIAGARPVGGDNALVIALKVERGEVIPLVRVAPQTPPELAGLIHRAMAATPALRFASATDMRTALENVRARAPEARPPTVPLMASPLALAATGSQPPHAAHAGHAAEAQLGSGTEMGAPIPAALRAAIDAGPQYAQHQAHGQAQAGYQAPAYNAPAAQQAPMNGYGAQPPHQPHQPSQQQPRAHAATHMPEAPSFVQPPAPERRRAKKGFPWWILILAVLLGGGVIGGIVGWNYYYGDDTPAPVATAVPVAPPTTPATATPGTAPTPTPADTGLAPLTTSTVPVAPTPGPGPKPKPTPSASGSAGPPPVPTTPAFPGIPTAFPSSLPFPLPTASAFPLPSGLPNIFAPPTAPTTTP